MGFRQPPGVVTGAAQTAWERGRFDARPRKSKVLFGRMYEDASIELAAFEGRSRILCIASAGCTALRLAPRHEVVAVDINAAQLEYARSRFAGAPPVPGAAERMMSLARAFAPALGWRRPLIRAFLDLADPAEQVAFWRQRLDTRRFRLAFDGLLSTVALRAVYAAPFLDFLPARLGSVLRARMERCFATHPNRTNSHARALLAGDLGDDPTPPEATRIRPVHADVAAWLESEPKGGFDGFTLSNILDGASPGYRERLFTAVRRAAAPGAVAILRSFAEPSTPSPWNRAVDDRSMLWGIVEVRPAQTVGET